MAVIMPLYDNSDSSMVTLSVLTQRSLHLAANTATLLASFAVTTMLAFVVASFTTSGFPFQRPPKDEIHYYAWALGLGHGFTMLFLTGSWSRKPDLFVLRVLASLAGQASFLLCALLCIACWRVARLLNRLVRKTTKVECEVSLIEAGEDQGYCDEKICCTTDLSNGDQ